MRHAPTIKIDVGLEPVTFLLHNSSLQLVPIQSVPETFLHDQWRSSRLCVCVLVASLRNRGSLFSSLYQRSELSSLLMRTTSPAPETLCSSNSPSISLCSSTSLQSSTPAFSSSVQLPFKGLVHQNDKTFFFTYLNWNLCNVN